VRGVFQRRLKMRGPGIGPALRRSQPPPLPHLPSLSRVDFVFEKRLRRNSPLITHNLSHASSTSSAQPSAPPRPFSGIGPTTAPPDRLCSAPSATPASRFSGALTPPIRRLARYLIRRTQSDCVCSPRQVAIATDLIASIMKSPCLPQSTAL